MLECVNRPVNVTIDRYSKKNNIVHSQISIHGKDITRGYENALSLLKQGKYLGYVYKNKDITKSYIKILFKGHTNSSIRAGQQCHNLKLQIGACLNTNEFGGTYTYEALKKLCNELPLGVPIVIEIIENYQV